MRKDIDPSSLRVCYFNITPSDFSRSGVHMQALVQKGVQVVPCVDSSPGVRKFWELFKKHRALRGMYDVIIVGYPAYILVPFARLISRKPILFDAGWSLYEGTIVARGLYTRQPLHRLYYWSIDWLAYQCADLVLLESDHQVAYYRELLRVRGEKCLRLYTGVDESQLSHDPSIKKRDTFTVLFRGYANPEAGLLQLIAAARELENEKVQFLFISPNFRLTKDLPANVELRAGFFSTAELNQWMQECHISTGHVSTSPRLERTIPHKAFESMLLRLPFVTADATGIRELLGDESAVLVRPGNVADITAKIRELKNNPARVDALASLAWHIYQEKCSNAVLGEELMGHIDSVLN